MHKLPPLRTLTVVFSLLAFVVSASADYPLLSVHPGYLGSSGERGQILVDGIVKKISVFHGRSDDEADWHVYVDLTRSTSEDLANHLRARGIDVTAANLDLLYSELMTLDRHKSTWFDEFFYSADFTSSLLLHKSGSAHPAWDLGVFAANNQGTNHDLSSFSRLAGARAYLQGSLVNDAEHGTRVEIHPLDSIAFAMDSSGTPLSIKRGETGWPRTYVRWRVGVFANSNYHRINGENYVKKERTTTWFLDLPSNAYTILGQSQVSVIEERQQLWNGGLNAWYSGRRWKTLVPWTLAIDPKDGRRKLKVTTTMLTPDEFGGIIVRDYIVRVESTVHPGN